MNRISTIVTLGLMTISLAAEDGKVYGKLDGQVLATGGGKILIFDSNGRTIWSHKASKPHDVWMLPGGNVLYAGPQVIEINPKTNEVVFKYKSKTKSHEGAFSCQRLADGMTLIGENSTGKILEVAKDGKIVFELQLPNIKIGNHHNMRMARKLDNGNYLVCHSGRKLVREYTPEGKIALEIKTGNVAFSASRLPNGNTLVGHINNITEFDPEGKKVWEFNHKKDAGEFKIGWTCGVHTLGNGNMVVGLYRSQRGKKGAAIFEMTRDKKILWRYVGKDAHMMSAQKLTADGKVLSNKKTLR